MRLALIVLLTASVIGIRTACADDDTDAAIETVSSTVGEILALGDLCEWNFAPRVDKLIQDGAKALRLSLAKQKDVRGRIATAREQTFGRLSATGQARMRADICKPEERARLEAMIAKSYF